MTARPDPATVGQRRDLRPGRGACASRLAGVWAVRTATAALWAAVAAGPLLGAFALLRPAVALAPRAAAPAARDADAAAPLGWAELYVAAFLSADPAAVAVFHPGARLDGVTPGRLFAARTAAVDSELVGPDAWAVTVAADVLAADADAEAEGGWEPAGLRCYRVGVTSAQAGLAAAGLPGQVACPATAGGGAVRLRPVEAGDASAEAVEGLLAALLTGRGEVSRYSAPGAGLAAVDPAPFAEVEVRRVGDVATPQEAAAAVVAVEVAATTADGAIQVLGYLAELAERDGRLEVRRLLAAPPGAGESHATQDPTSTEEP